MGRGARLPAPSRVSASRCPAPVTQAKHRPGEVASMVDDRARLDVATLGPCRIESPLGRLLHNRGTSQHYVEESDRVLLDDTVAMVAARGVPLAELPSFEP